uniref:Uncharacterized protein n=1 Tax=Opuntia streptacantha TaxID=393608 RepID=A0A7C9DJ36_OPUST
MNLDTRVVNSEANPVGVVINRGNIIDIEENRDRASSINTRIPSAKHDFSLNLSYEFIHEQEMSRKMEPYFKMSSGRHSMGFSRLTHNGDGIPIHRQLGGANGHRL